MLSSYEEQYEKRWQLPQGRCNTAFLIDLTHALFLKVCISRAVNYDLLEIFELWQLR